FPQQFIQGAPEIAWSRFQTMVLTESMAMKLFGSNWKSDQVIEREIRVGEEVFTVGGVVQDPPGNMHFRFGAIVHQEQIPSWGAYTYVKLLDDNQIARVMTRFNNESDLVYPGRSEDILQKGSEAVALTDIHFTKGMLYEIKPTANFGYLITFGVVGVIILLIIWTNYTNLAIVTYANRQKELGLRKTLGARSKDIAGQVLIEATLLTLISLPVSWLIVYLLIPELNELLNISFDRMYMTHPLALGIFIILLLGTGLLSGLYPSLVYSRKSLTKLLHGKLNATRTGTKLNLRNSLLTAQFFMLVVLVSITLVIRQQMTFIQQREMGFEKEGVVYFEVDGIEKYNLLAPQLKQLTEVKKVSNGMIPGQDMYYQLTYKMKDTETTFADGTFIYTSGASFDVLGITSDALRDLDEKGKVFVINRTAAEKLAVAKGVPVDELVGQTLVTEPEMETETGFGEERIIGGIIENFDYFNLKYESQPLLIEVREQITYVYNMMLKVDTDNWVNTISDIEAVYLSIEKDKPFELTFLDNHLDQIYREERNAGVLTAGLTGISLGLAVMGLIGIVGFMTLSRQKEIGVRKVFGATVRDILIILNKDYLMMMLIATALSVPVVLYLSNRWLDSFAYHISPGIATVAFAGILTLAVVLIVVVSQSLRSAAANPTDTLRNE
ncbi:MAG: FtsX-like permease family protein, partial [Cyclobacteriaceae bacterium]